MTTSDNPQNGARRHVRLPGSERRRRRSSGAEMALVEHLKELRRRLLVALLAMAVGTVLGFIWYGVSIGPVPSLGEILRGPYCALDPDLRFGSENGECRLLATAPLEQFILRLKLGSIIGLVLSAPVWLGQLWGFITPGLKKNEKRWTRTFVGSATLLFIIGAVLAYVVLVFAFEFLLSIGSEAQIAALTGTDYFNFVLGLLLIFGVSFEVPLVVVMLNLAGVLPYSAMKTKRRYLVVGLFIFAALITPGQDPFSMSALAVTLCLLMEIAMQISRVHDKRKAKKAGLDGLPTEIADETGSEIDAARPVSAARTVSADRVEAPSPVREVRPERGFDYGGSDDIL
jgi:sec-independent protein translocase protein TatC